MARTLLLRGMLVGVVAAVAAFLVATAFGEGPLGHALAFESARDAATGGQGRELVPRATQSTVGLFTGLVGFAVALGGIFAVAYACVQGRLGSLGARSTAALVALAGFVGLYLIPDLKYPANPPSIGNPDTIGRRTALYFTMMAISLAVVIGAPLVARRLAGRFGGWNAALLAAAGSLVVIAAAYLLLPPAHETPAGFPADVLWRFRIAAAAIQVTVWATLGLFGVLTDRHLRAASTIVADQRCPAPAGPSIASDRTYSHRGTRQPSSPGGHRPPW